MNFSLNENTTYYRFSTKKTQDQFYDVNWPVGDEINSPEEPKRKERANKGTANKIGTDF